jgi:hypothetical protein
MQVFYHGDARPSFPGQFQWLENMVSYQYPGNWNGGLSHHQSAFSQVCNDIGRLHSTDVGLQAQVSQLEEAMNMISASESVVLERMLLCSNFKWHHHMKRLPN